MVQRFRFDDWDALVEELRRFGEGASVTADDDSIRIDFGAGAVELERSGRVRTGMALHDFEHEGEVSVVVDHDAGSLTIESDAVTYTFRRPGG